MGKAGKNQIVALLLIVFMVSFCAFSHHEPIMLNTASQSDAREAVLVSAATFSDCNDMPKVEEQEVLSLYRLTEETSRLRMGRSGFTYFVAFYFWAMQLYFLAALFPYPFSRSDITPRYSIISYIHRSHGKKTALMFMLTA